MSAVEVLQSDPAAQAIIDHWPSLTPTQHAFLIALERAGSVSAAARTLGIHRQRVHEWARDDSCFADALGQTKEVAIDNIEAKMYDQALHGDLAWDTTARIFLLKSLRRDIYGEKLDVTSKSISINLTGDIASLTDTDRVSLLQLAADEQRRLLESPEPSHPDDQD